MRNIIKGAEPKSLEVHRCSEHADYGNLPTMTLDEIRRHLVAEQGGICCYCMERIIPDGSLMKIEHWLSQDDNPDHDLDYKNMLGACNGVTDTNILNQRGKLQVKRLTHCDTARGSTQLSRNPANLTDNVEKLIHYLADGTIFSYDERFQHDICKTLNLNHEIIKENRKAVLIGFIKYFKKGKSLSKTDLKKYIDQWNVPENGQFKQYCQVIIYWLRKRLARA
jgi:uncharacterized protein (TIGR02646 family)